MEDNQIESMEYTVNVDDFEIIVAGKAARRQGPEVSL